MIIIEYVIRENIDTGRIFYTGMAPYYKSTHKTELSALKEAREILRHRAIGKNKLYITRTEYANEKQRNRDFHITSNIIWSDWFNGAEGLDEMIANLEKEEMEDEKRCGQS